MSHDDAVEGTRNQLLNQWLVNNFNSTGQRNKERARQAGLSGSFRLHLKPTVLPPFEGQAEALFQSDSRSVA